MKSDRFYMSRDYANKQEAKANERSEAYLWFHAADLHKQNLNKDFEDNHVDKFDCALDLLLAADNNRCRLPILPKMTLTDAELGHWDLYWPEGKAAPGKFYDERKLGAAYAGRNPAQDLCEDAVAIDFGTSSTVVAIKNRRGRKTLLRIGATENDLCQAAEARHFENPTVLNFDHLGNFLKYWQKQPYRPEVSFYDCQCSHEAKEGWKSRIEGSLTELKTWARGRKADKILVIRDKENHPQEIKFDGKIPSMEIEKSIGEAPLNPIEIYAFYLGLFLNNQSVKGGRIYRKYYLTFPVKFSRATCDFILNSFRRGLIRSLPPSLLYASGFKPSEIIVEERANEAVAFAAAALPILDGRKAIIVTENGISDEACEDDEELDANAEKAREVFEDATATFAEMRSFMEEQKNLLLQMRDVLENMEDSEAEQEETARNIAEMDALMAQLDPESNSETRQNLEELKGLLEEYDERKNKKTSYPLAQVSVKPDDLVFGIFDFGGGTTDMAIGIYREPTEKEENDNNWEEVIEVLDNRGDEDLGGEHLLEGLAMRIARANKDKLLQDGIFPFLEAGNEELRPGEERLFRQSGVARNNTRRIMERMRPFWEKEESEEYASGQITETLVNEQGEELPVTLNINLSDLEEFLRKRIDAGVRDFFDIFIQACKRNNLMPRDFHIILAGNSCKSPLVLNAFVREARELLAGGVEERVIIHPPLEYDAKNPEAATLKTGVALGLLSVLPGEATGIVSRVHTQGETQFPWCVGPRRRGFLEPALKRGTQYNEWHYFAKVPQEGTVLALYSKSPIAMEGRAKRGADCLEAFIDFGSENMGKDIIVKADKPDKITFAVIDDDKEILLQKTIGLE